MPSDFPFNNFIQELRPRYLDEKAKLYKLLSFKEYIELFLLWGKKGE